jgi:hypothetical protein
VIESTTEASSEKAHPCIIFVTNISKVTAEASLLEESAHVLAMQRHAIRQGNDAMGFH